MRHTRGSCAHIRRSITIYYGLFELRIFCRSLSPKSFYAYKKKNHRRTHKSLDLLLHAVPLSIRFTGSKRKVHAVIPRVRSEGA